MAIQTPIPLRSQGLQLSETPDTFGELRDSSAIADDDNALRARMEEDGYLLLPGYLDREEVLAARLEILERIAGEGGLKAGTDPIDGILDENISVRFRPDLTRKSDRLRKVLFDGRMIAFFERFLEGEVRHFDFIWLRAVSPGRGTPPHGDSVFMNRGTTRLYTAWTPLGDIDRVLGGLIVLENSHRLDEIKNSYGQLDVDTYCENDRDKHIYEEGWSGYLSKDPVELRNKLGGRWLTADYRAGDLLVFSLYTLHASLDNQSADRIRLSSDTRYQLASEPVDERWIGDDPIAHGPDAKKGIIC